MARILVSGLINLETTVQVDGFPIEYAPVRYPFFGVQSRVSGVGFNIAKALTMLGNEVRLCALIGADEAGMLTRQALEQVGLNREFLQAHLNATPQSVILTDPHQRSIFTDLKDVQEHTYPVEGFERALVGVDVVIACNLNASRPLLHLAQAQGVPVVTDLHAIRDLENPYDQEFLGCASLLFLSGERLEHPEHLALEVLERFPAKIVVIGLGSRGALLAVRDQGRWLVPAVQTRSVVSTVGAGDALLSGFVHHYVRTGDARAALERATVFASWKIGEAGGANGFLREDELERLSQEHR